ncbi:hypothetical protein QWY16_15020 [Planococcus shenhongbingii]|uniref:hypothetical protein n=1 Tax=Planococcus shenhongbingii TaxID=3058398 RepID=UPI00261643F5|nr:hypothetical protein [Planococcus sp. N016]WKA57797.1 hypothetical protein QWY16_15020 [Planococcus sp. N016]
MIEPHPGTNWGRLERGEFSELLPEENRRHYIVGGSISSTCGSLPHSAHRSGNTCHMPDYFSRTVPARSPATASGPETEGRAIFEVDHEVQRKLDPRRRVEIRNLIIESLEKNEHFYFSPFIFSSRKGTSEVEGGFELVPGNKIYVLDGQHHPFSP